MNIKKFFKAFHKALEEEKAEVINLEVTEEDYAQASKVANIACDALMAYGIPVGSLGRKILTKAIAYGLRDIKDGVKSPDKLIFKRIINELRREDKEEEKAEE